MAKNTERDADDCLSGRELAELLHVSASTISKDLSRAPYRLPPVVRVPGRKKAIWLRSTVMAWLMSHQDEAKAGWPNSPNDWQTPAADQEGINHHSCPKTQRRRRTKVATRIG